MPDGATKNAVYFTESDIRHNVSSGSLLSFSFFFVGQVARQPLLILREKVALLLHSVSAVQRISSQSSAECCTLSILSSFGWFFVQVLATFESF